MTTIVQVPVDAEKAVSNMLYQLKSDRNKVVINLSDYLTTDTRQHLVKDYRCDWFHEEDDLAYNCTQLLKNLDSNISGLFV